MKGNTLVRIPAHTANPEYLDGKWFLICPPGIQAYLGLEILLAQTFLRILKEDATCFLVPGYL